MPKVWLLFVDLDGTLWDHKDVSSLNPPFRRISNDAVEDSNGTIVRLYREMAKLIMMARRMGAIVSSLSWNLPGHALAAIRAFGLESLFDYHAIEPHPHKGEYARRVLMIIKRERGIDVPPCRIVYIDDRTIHLEDVKRSIGDIVFLQAWRDFKTAEEALDIIRGRLCGWNL